MSQAPFNHVAMRGKKNESNLIIIFNFTNCKYLSYKYKKILETCS